MFRWNQNLLELILVLQARGLRISADPCPVRNELKYQDDGMYPHDLQHTNRIRPNKINFNWYVACDMPKVMFTCWPQAHLREGMFRIKSRSPTPLHLVRIRWPQTVFGITPGIVTILVFCLNTGPTSSSWIQIHLIDLSLCYLLALLRVLPTLS